MNNWANAVMTQQGLALQAKLIAGNRLQVTKVQIGSGSVTPGLLMQQIMVSDPKVTLTQVTSITYPESGKCAVKINVDNASIAAGFTAMQIGFYAQDPDVGEILYFIAQAEAGAGTIVPSKSEMAGYSAEWTVYFQYGQADGVNVTVDPSNTVSKAEMESYIEQNTINQSELEIYVTQNTINQSTLESYVSENTINQKELEEYVKGNTISQGAVESLIEEALKDFDRLSMQPGHRTTDTLATAGNLDTWTSVITDTGGQEVARKVDKEGKQPDGKAMWTTTITIGDKVVTVTDKETDNGWTREVK